MIQKSARGSVPRAITFDDVPRYSRNAPHGQQGLLRSVRDARDDAALSAGISAGREYVQNHGDGELVRWGEDVRGLDLLDRYLPALAVELDKANESRREEHWARLRLAVVEGYSRLNDDGALLGAAPVLARRFLDCEQCRQALDLLPNRPLVAVIDSGLYDVVKQRYGSLAPEKFVPIQVDIPEKGFSEPAWLTVPGCDAAELELLRKELARPQPREERRRREREEDREDDREVGEEEGDGEGDAGGDTPRPAAPARRRRWTSNQALATVIAAMITALGALLPSLPWNREDDPGPWVDVTGTCTAPGTPLHVASGGFTPGKPYTVAVTDPDHRPYDLSNGSSGTATGQGTLNTGWTCETQDTPGTYTITVTDSTTGESARDTFQVARVG